MVSALEDTLAAKDELLALRDASHRAEIDDIAARHDDAVAACEEEVRAEFASEIRSLTERLAVQAQAHEAEKQRILAEKQAEMDAALASCQEAICRAEQDRAGGGGGDGGGSNEGVEAVLAQMRDALAAKEEEKLTALAARDREAEATAAAHRDALQRALKQKDRELDTAMEQAQAAVDRLLEEKQEEVEALLDERDLVIRTQQVQLQECRLALVSGVKSASGSGGGCLANDGGDTTTHLHEMVRLKTEESVAMDKVLRRAQQRITVLESEVGSLEARLANAEAARAEVERDHERLSSQMQVRHTSHTQFHTLSQNHGARPVFYPSLTRLTHSWLAGGTDRGHVGQG